MLRRRPPADVVAGFVRDAAALDPKSVDALYGLEPVFEPTAAPGVSGVREFAEVQCPSCGEVGGTMIDLTSGERAYIEDCQVCCQPMLITIHVGDRGELVAVTAQAT